MIDEIRTDGLQNADPESPSIQELEEEGQRFAAAVARAKAARGKLGVIQTEARAAGRWMGGASRNKWRAAAVALLVVVGLAGIVLLRTSKVVVAGQLAGVSGVVTNTVTNRAQQGVMFRHMGGLRDGSIACISDAMGIYSLPAPPNAGGEEYAYSFGGKQLGTLVVGPDAPQISGQEQLDVHIEREQLKLSAQVRLSPGETRRELLPGVTISLGDDSTSEWEGTVEYSTDWPACFAYGRVLDGIYRVTGPETQALTLRVKINDEVLASLEGNRDEIQLISNEPSYADSRSELYGTSGLFPAVDGGFHRGWFVTDNPYGSLPKGPSLTLQSDGSANFAIWRPAAGKPYALLLRQRRQGEASAAWLGTPRSGSDQFDYTPIVGVLGAKALDNSLYHFRFALPGGEEIDFGSYPDIYRPYKLFGDEAVAKKRQDGDKAAFAFQGIGEHTQVEGQYLVYIMDFTIAKPFQYPGVGADFSVPPPQLTLELKSNGFGKEANCRVLGQVPELARPIEWDLGEDGILDGKGESFDFLVPGNGSYSVQATVYRKSGLPILLRSSLNLAPEVVIGYTGGSVVDQPVLRASDALPERESAIRYVSINSTSRPAELAWLTSAYAGPSFYLELPEEFRNTPYKEIRIFAYSSPRGGDNERFPFSSDIQFVGHVVEGATYPFDISCSRIPGTCSIEDLNPGGWLGHQGSRSHECLQALRAHQREPRDGARRFYIEYIATRSSLHILESTERIVGIDPRNPPAEDELVRKLEEFRASPYFAHMFTTSEEQLLSCKSNSQGSKPPREAIGLLFTLIAETQNVLYAAQWDLYSGPKHPSRIEIETMDGKVLTRYFDYSGYQLEDAE